ncbi:unnamed protein product [Sphenostylis stenocarpa]|uniref:FBD domain-containing protein n=1 Tax=Sphenostylis stenocarpa TaxID=92480 RepID=A0AA86SV43_9FABA|nr:unnamed protein product [Sphenostylis stenocarpa]
MEEADLDFSLEYGFEGHGHLLCNLVEGVCAARVLAMVKINGFKGTDEILVLKCFINGGVFLKKIRINMLKDGFGRTVEFHCREKAEFLLTICNKSDDVSKILLPLELLLIIVSFLPFKEAVRNSVLFKNWFKACKSTKNVEFNELFFVKPDQSSETREAQRTAFLDFIRIWIANHKGADLDKFSLKLSIIGNVGEIIDQCVDFATRREVKELELDFTDSSWDMHEDYFADYEAPFELPRQTYAHIGLEYLKLYSCSFLETEVRNFRVLKEVSLGWMKVSLTAIKALLSNCEMLRSLSFKRCWNAESFHLGQEETAGLRKFVIERCRFGFDSFKVNAPNLKIFKYFGRMRFNIMTEIHSTEMEEVDLDFTFEYLYQGYGHALHCLLKQLSTARVLTVCSYMLQIIPSGPEQLQMEHSMHVRHLIMKASLHEDELLGIAFFLNSCPILECLTIQLCLKNDLSDNEEPFYFNLMRFWVDFLGDCECLRSSLEVVEINGYRGEMNENLLLKYLIFSGLLLKKMNINLLRDESGRLVESHSRQYAEDLFTIHRASIDLEISIY